MNEESKSVVLAMSGGLDSATLCAKLLSEGNTVYAVSFKYGSQHNKYELKAADDVAKYFKTLYPKTFMGLNTIDVSGIFEGMSTPFLKANNKEIPEGDYNSETMKDTVVPCRNVVFTSILAGIADDKKCDCIAIGIHAGDHCIYPDCRPEFYNAMEKAVNAATDGKVSFIAPFVNISKADIVEIGTALNFPYEITRTCYKDQPYACGKCGSCNERLEAFELNGLKDPAIYGDGNITVTNSDNILDRILHKIEDVICK